MARSDSSLDTLLSTLTVPQRTKANKRAIESLAPQIDALAERLCKPVPVGDIAERERRNRFEQWVYTLQG